MHIVFKRPFLPLNANDISLFFIGLMFFLPFINMHHLRPLPVFYSEWIAGLMGLIGFAVYFYSASWHKPPQQIKIPQVSLIFVGLMTILCIQWALGMLHSNQYTLLALSYLIWAFLMVVLGGLLRQGLGLQKIATTLGFCLVIAGGINVLIVVLQFVSRTGGVVPLLPNLSSFGALAQSNHFASFISLTIASLIYLHARGNFSKSFFYLVLLLFIFLLSFSGSRSAWLYLFSVTIFTGILHSTHKKQKEKENFQSSAKMAALCLLPIFALIQLFIHFLIPHELVNLPTERLLNGITAPNPSLRLQLWHDSIIMFFQSPWLGIGAGKLMANTFLLVDHPLATSKLVFEHAHNLFLHLLAEMGLLAIIIVLFGLVAWVRAFKWRTLNLETWWLICLLSIISIHSMLEYPLWFAFFLGVFSILLGTGDENTVSIRLSIFPRKVIYGCLILIFMLGILNLGTMLIANIKLENWIDKFTNQDKNDVADLNWARQFSLLSTSGVQMHALTMGIDSNHLNENLEVTQSAMNFKPNAIVAYKHSLLLKLNGKNKDATLQFKRASLAYPKQFNIVLENTPKKYRRVYTDIQSETQSKVEN